MLILARSGKKHADLLAAAPDLLRIVMTMLALREYVDPDDILGDSSSLVADAKAIAAKIGAQQGGRT